MVSGLKFHAARGPLIGLRCLHEEVLVHLTLILIIMDYLGVCNVSYCVMLTLWTQKWKMKKHCSKYLLTFFCGSQKKIFWCKIHKKFVFVHTVAISVVQSFIWMTKVIEIFLLFFFSFFVIHRRKSYRWVNDERTFIFESFETLAWIK